MRGSTPLDVAAASVLDNNELALAIQEGDLEKVLRCCESFAFLLNLRTGFYETIERIMLKHIHVKPSCLPVDVTGRSAHIFEPPRCCNQHS